MHWPNDQRSGRYPGRYHQQQEDINCRVVREEDVEKAGGRSSILNMIKMHCSHL